MTNLEAFKNKICDDISVCEAAYICRYGCRCFGKNCQGCEFFGDTAECINAMLAENKGQSKIKLTRWEYDLLWTNSMPLDLKFSSFRTYQNMKSIGYFKGIKDTSMTLREIIENCEVIEDD